MLTSQRTKAEVDAGTTAARLESAPSLFEAGARRLLSEVSHRFAMDQASLKSR